MSVLDSIGGFVKKITDIIMPPVDPAEEDEPKETHKAETKEPEKAPSLQRLSNRSKPPNSPRRRPNR